MRDTLAEVVVGRTHPVVDGVWGLRPNHRQLRSTESVENLLIGARYSAVTSTFVECSSKMHSIGAWSPASVVDSVTGPMNACTRLSVPLDVELQTRQRIVPAAGDDFQVPAPF